jgi:hypothetical protein
MVAVGGVMVIRLVTDYGELVKVRAGKRVGGYVKSYGGCWVLWPFCVFWSISVVVVESVCVRICRGLVCAVGRVG